MNIGECWDCSGEGCYACGDTGQRCNTCGESAPHCESDPCEEDE